jgi:PhoPQ-activated pathogenicity-related protein
MVRGTRHVLIAFSVMLGLAACEKQAQEISPQASVEQSASLEVRPEERTALDTYVEVKDPVYGWKEVSSFAGDGYTGHVLELTSQSWRTDADVDRPVWTHWLTVLIPTEVTSDKALLFIGGGDNGDPVPTKASDRAARIAVETRSVVADLGMVPNQPLYFTDTPKTARYEDDLIAYSRVKHFTTKDDTWLVRLAMVKSGVRAMDAVQEFIDSRQDTALKVNEFVVAGGSKRGWTTWLVGAVDPRVIAIMPLVIDALNSEAITRHHFEVLGFFAPSLEDYVNNGLFPHKIGTPEYQEVLAIEDPYNYRGRARLTIPKFLMNASGDEFFLPDNSQFYYADLPAEKRLRYVPNSRHNLAETDAVDSMLAFYRSVIDGKSRPEYSWTKGTDGTLVVKTATKPSAVTLWQATNPNARDFRVEEIGKAYVATPLEAQGDGTFMAKVAPPEKGFTAFFIELTFDSGAPTPFKFSTEVSIVPNVIPYKFEDAAAKYPLKAQP